MAAIEKNNEWVDDILEEGEVDESQPGKENDKLRCNVEACQGKAFAKPFALLRHWAEIHEHQVTCVWNTLPDVIRASPSLASFRKQLKTYLYTKAYPP